MDHYALPHPTDQALSLRDAIGKGMKNLRIVGTSLTHEDLVLVGRYLQSQKPTTLYVLKPLPPGALPALCEYLQSNTSLRRLRFGENQLTHQDYEHIQEALKYNNSLEKIWFVDQPVCLLDTFWPALENKRSLRTLGLFNTHLRAGGQFKYLCTLLLPQWKGPLELRVGGNHLDDGCIEQLCESLKRATDANATLCKLGLENSAFSDRGMKHLFLLLRRVPTLTHLDIRNNALLTNVSADFLGKLLNLHAKLDISYEGTGIDERMVSRAQEAAADRAQVLQMGGGVKVTRPRLFVCGHEFAGKTTLTRTLQGEPPVQGFQRLDHAKSKHSQDPENRTAGVAIKHIQLANDHESREFTLYDLAGQSQFFTSHSLVCRDGIAVVLLVISLKDKPKEREKRLEFWLRFLKARFSASDDAKLSVHVVLTHRDIEGLNAIDVDQDARGTWTSHWGQSQVADKREIYKDFLDIDSNVYVVSTDEDDECMGSLRDALLASHGRVVDRSPEAPRLTEMVAKVLMELRGTIAAEVPILRKDQFTERLTKHSDLHEFNLQDATWYPILRFLQTQGEIIWLEKSMLVVVQPDFLCSNVMAKLFAPEWFVVKLDQKKRGKVQYRSILSVFPELKPDQVEKIISVMRELEFMFELGPDLFLLPALLKKSAPDKHMRDWREARPCDILGRRLVCTAETDTLGRPFFHLLQVRLCREVKLEGFFSKHEAIGHCCGADFRGFVYVSMREDKQLEICVCASNPGDALTALSAVVKAAKDVAADVCSFVAVEEHALSPAGLRQWNEGSLQLKLVGSYDLKRLDTEQHTSITGFDWPKAHGVQNAEEEDVARILGQPCLALRTLWPTKVLNVREGRLRVLVVRANPKLKKRPLDLDTEDHVIQEAARKSPFAAWICASSCVAFTEHSLAEKLKEHQPHCVHLMGHHSEQDGFWLHKDEQLPGTRFLDMLRRNNITLACLVVNSCNSEQFVQQLKPEQVKFAACTTDKIKDETGVLFASHFWEALFQGHHHFADAFKKGQENCKKPWKYRLFCSDGEVEPTDRRQMQSRDARPTRRQQARNPDAQSQGLGHHLFEIDDNFYHEHPTAHRRLQHQHAAAMTAPPGSTRIDMRKEDVHHTRHRAEWQSSNYGAGNHHSQVGGPGPGGPGPGPGHGRFHPRDHHSLPAFDSRATHFSHHRHGHDHDDQHDHR